MPEATASSSRHPARRAAARRAARWGRRRLRRAQFGWPLALALGGSLAAPAYAQNLPQGGNVVGGSGTIQQIDANLLQIQQNSQNLAIDWQSFNVGPSGIVRFLQPSSSAIALNRVIGNDPSAIYGQIQANGQVILLNPRGIYFGPGSMVDVNAMVATTANIRNDDFMAGRLSFEEGSGDANARVVNEGLVSVAQGGFAILAAASVQNTGRIVANGGTVVLAGTKTFTVDFHGDGLLSFAATGAVDQAPAGASALVDNSGIIEATGGRVLMTARAARDVLDNVINTTGIVVARSAQMVNGEIVIDGGDNGIVNVNGTLDASGRNAGETGGTVKVLGEKVGLFADARIDAAGDAGGGTVLVGGNYQGQGPEPNARMVYMDAAAVIDASAVTAGNGGKVILWADETTRFDGRISARGGALGGDGGFVETSGKIVLRVGLDAMVDAAAAAGRNGVWLLDPNNISIVAGAGGSTNITGNPSFLSTDDSAQIYDTTINTALDIGNDVTVTTGTGGTNGQAGLITVSGDILNSSGGTRTLTLSTALGAINITGTIEGTSGNALSVVLDAPTGAVAINGGIDTYGGTLTINAGIAVTQTAAVSSGAGTLPLVLNLTGSATANLTNAGNDFFGITLNSTSTGAISIATSTTPQLQTSSIAGDLTLTSANSGFIQAGALTATGGGTVTIDGGSGNVTLDQTNSFQGDLTVYGGSIDTTTATLNFDNSSSRNVTFTQTGAAGTITLGNMSAAVGGSIHLTADAATQIKVVGNIITRGGNVTLNGNAPGGNPASGTGVGNHHGVWIDNATVDAGGGFIDIAGRGGNNSANHGVYMSGSNLVTTGASAITVTGRGDTTAASQYGVNIVSASTIEADGGAINITGQGGSYSTGWYRVGVNVSGASLVQSTGAGNVTITGTAGGGAGNGLDGTIIADAGTFVGKTANGAGSVTITGTGGGADNNNIGLRLTTGAIVNSLDGTLTLTGTSGGAATGYNAPGIEISGATEVRSTTGNINITGTAVASSNFGNIGVSVSPNSGTATVTSTSGDITITGYGGGSSASNEGVNFDSNQDMGGGVITITGHSLSGSNSALTLGHVRSSTATLMDLRAAPAGGTGGIAFFGVGSETDLGGTSFAGDMTLRADSINNAASTLFIRRGSSGGTLTFRPETDSTTIGVNGGAGGLQVDATVLGAISNFQTVAVGSITQTGAIDANIWTPGRDVALITGAGGAITTDALTMGTNTLTINNGGAYTQVGGISGSGLVVFNGVGAVTATDPGNSFTNLIVSKTGSAATSITTTGAVNLANVSLGTGAFNLTAGGIAQSGAIATGGSIFFNAGANAITLSHASNSIAGNVRFFNSGANNVTLYNNTATVFGGGTTTVGGDLDVTSNGDLTQASALSVAGNASFDAMGNTLTLTNASNAVTGSVSFNNFSGVGVTSWREAAAVDIGATIVNDFSVQAGGAITQSGAIQAGYSSTFDAGANPITLTNAGNQLSSTIIVQTTGGSGHVQLTNSVNTYFGASSIGGDLTVTRTSGAGDMLQSAPISVGGTTTIAMNSGALTLDQGANSFTGSVSITKTGTGTVTLQNGAPLDLGASSIAGDLVVTANAGGISQTGVLTLGGDFTATAAGTLTLSEANSYAAGKNVSLTATGASGTITVSADQILSSGNFTAVGSAGVAVNAAVDTGGGNVTIWGNSPGGVANGSTAGSFFGVNVDGASAHIDAGGGNISIVGAGGSANYMHGVSIRNGAYVQTSGTGTLDITGRGGSGTAGGSAGVEFYASSAYAQTQNGALTVTGIGGIGGGDGNTGVVLATGEVRATGAGTVTVTGTGGVGGSVGIHVGGGGASVISAVNGNMVLIGTGGSGDDLSGIFAGSHSWGVSLGINADVKTTGSGNLSVTANGGTDGVSDFRIGMVMEQAALLRTTGSGFINLTANAGTGAGGDNHGLYMLDTGTAVRTGSGDLSVTATGSGSAGAAGNGIVVDGAVIESTGTGNVTVAGTGGYDGKGVVVQGAGGAIQTVDGDVDVTGIGGATAASADLFGIHVVDVAGAGTIQSTGIGSVTLTGTGGAAATSNNHGVVIETGIVQAGSGGIVFDGTGGGGGTAAGVVFVSGAVATTTSGGNIAIDGSGAGDFGISAIGSATITSAGNLTLSSDNGMSMASADLIVAGTLGAVSTFANVDLSSTSNAIAGAIALSVSGGGNALLGNSLATTLAATNISGDLTVSVADDITQSAAMTVGGASSFASTGGSIVLTNASNVLTGAITVSNATANPASIVNSVATTLNNAMTTGDLSVTSGGILDQIGSVIVGGDLALTADGNITMSNPANQAGSVSLATTSGGDATYASSTATSLKDVGVAGNLAVYVTGASIAQSGAGAYTVGGTTDLTTITSGGITLNQANSFGDAVTLTSAGTIDITAMQSVTANAFTATAGGAITVGSGGGVTTSGGTIDIMSSANIAMNTAVLTSNGGNITIDAGPGGFTSLELLFTNVDSGAGNITMTGTGDTTGSSQHGIWVGTGSAVQATGAGTITLTGTGGATSGSGNVGVFVYGGAVLSDSGAITINGTGGGTGASSGSNHGVAVASGGDITSTNGGISITGTGSTGGGSGTDNYGVYVDGSGSTIQGTNSVFVAINGTGGTSTGGGSSGILVGNGAMVMADGGQITATGTGGGGNSDGVQFLAGGSVGGLVSVGSAPVVVSGTASGAGFGIVSSGTTSVVGGGAATGLVELHADSMDLTAGVAIQTSNQARFNSLTPGLTLGLNDSSSGLNITSATVANVTASMFVLGDVAATGTITVGTDSANNFTTGVSLRNGGGANPINFVGALSTTGDLDILAGGAVTQTGALTVGGTSYFNAGGNVTLTNAANAMSGDIAFSAMGGNVTLANSGSTSLGASITTGTLSVSVTGGTVSQTGAIQASGALTLTSDSAVNWNNASNAFGGPLNITTTAGADATVYNSLATTLDAITVAGNLDVASASTLGQGGSPLSVGGTSHFSSVGATTLANASNSFGSDVSLMTTSGGNATIAATGQLILGMSTIAGNFTASVGSPMTQTGALAVTGTSDFTATSGPLTLTNTSNTFGGAVTLTNSGNFAVGISASGALTLGNVSMTGGSTGGFTATASNGITQSGGTTIQAGAGATVLAGGGGTVVLGETGNSFGNTVSLSGTGGSLAGMVNGQSGAAAAAFVTATGGIFDVNGTNVGSATVTPPATGTQAVLNEIASVAPIDSATRVVDSPSTGGAGLGSPAIDSTLSSSTSDLSDGSGTGSGTSDEQTTQTVADGPTPATGQPAGGTAPAGATGGSGTPAPSIVLSEGGTGGTTPNDVRADPAPQLGPTTVIPGVLVSNPAPQTGTVGGTPGITQPFPQDGNSANWGPSS